MKVGNLVSSIAAITATLGLSAPIALADTQSSSIAPLNSAQVSSDFQQLINMGVSPETAQNLIAQVESGHTLDSMNPAMVSQIPNGDLVVTPDHPVSTYTFPDGSVYQLKLTVLSDKKVPVSTNTRSAEISQQATSVTVAQPASSGSGSTSGGTSSGGSGYEEFVSVQVNGAWVFGGASFDADFTMVQSPGQDYFSNIYTPQIYTVLGTWSNQNLSYLRKTEDVAENLPAEARLSFTYKGPTANVPQLDEFVQLNLGSTSYWVTTS